MYDRQTSERITAERQHRARRRRYRESRSARLLALIERAKRGGLAGKAAAIDAMQLAFTLRACHMCSKYIWCRHREPRVEAALLGIPEGL